LEPLFHEVVGHGGRGVTLESSAEKIPPRNFFAGCGQMLRMRSIYEACFAFTQSRARARVLLQFDSASDAAALHEWVAQEDR
jgi:hypothetical protein